MTSVGALADGSCVAFDRLDVAACLRDPSCHHGLVAAHRGSHLDAPEH